MRSPHAPDGLKEALLPTKRFFHDRGESEDERYRYLLNLPALGVSCNWDRVISRGGKRGAETLETEVITAFNIPKQEVVLYTLLIDGAPLAQNPHYHRYLYTTLVEKFFDESGRGTCYLCGKDDSPVTSDFARMRLKLFINQKVNFASGIRSQGFVKNYAVCRTCYEEILLGERFIERYLHTRMIGSRTYLIPELSKPEKLSADSLRKIAKEVVGQVGGLARLDSVPRLMDLLGHRQEYHQLTLLFAEKEQAGVKVLEIVPEVPPARLVRIAETAAQSSDIAKGLWSYREQGPAWFGGLDDLLWILPVRRAGTDILTRPALQMAKHILLGNLVEPRKLRADMLEVVRAIQYENPSFHNRGRDIHTYMLQALTFEVFLSKLGITQNAPLATEESRTMIETRIPEPYGQVVRALGMELPQQALFLLGVLVARVGSEQYKESTSGKKPILEKINYQGMSLSRIKNFAVDVFELLKINRRLDANAEEIYAAAHTLLDSNEKRWPLSDKENVYYLLGGYAHETRQIITGKNIGDQEEVAST